MPDVAHGGVGGCIQVAMGCAFKSSVCRDVDSEVYVGHEQSLVLLRGEQGAAGYCRPAATSVCKGYAGVAPHQLQHRMLLASTLTVQMLSTSTLALGDRCHWQRRHTGVLD